MHGYRDLAALIDAQRAALHHPNPRVTLDLARRADRMLDEMNVATMAPADRSAAAHAAVEARHAVIRLADEVQTELRRLQVELEHLSGQPRPASAPRLVNYLAR